MSIMGLRTMHDNLERHQNFSESRIAVHTAARISEFSYHRRSGIEFFRQQFEALRSGVLFHS